MQKGDVQALEVVLDVERPVGVELEAAGALGGQGPGLQVRHAAGQHAGHASLHPCRPGGRLRARVEVHERVTLPGHEARGGQVVGRGREVAGAFEPGHEGHAAVQAEAA